MSDSKILTPQERLDLQSLIKANDTDDCTEEIRNKKQSILKQKYSRLQKSNPQEFDKICTNQCQFLFNNYTDIYNKIKSDLLNLNIFDKFLNILKQIEDGELNQHEGSYLVGKLLKELYIDSAMRNQERLDSKDRKKKVQKKPVTQEKKISYKDYKTMHQK